MPTEAEELKIHWQEARIGSSANSRTWLFEYYRGFSQSIAKKIFSRFKFIGVELDDVFQLAELGLLESIDRYDLNRKVDFRVYSGFRIKGSILNGIKNYSEKTRYYNFVALSGSTPPDFSVGDELGILSFDSLVEMTLDLGFSYLLWDYSECEKLVSSDSLYSRPEHDAYLVEILTHIERLTALKRRVILMCYLEELSYADIAVALNISKSRVCQLHRSAITEVRKMVNGVEEFFC